MPRKKSAISMAHETVGIRLSSHEKLCAERMDNILKALEDTRKEVKDLRQDVSKGKGAISVLVFLGTIIISCIGFFQFK
ncbi:hypothetical protein Hroenn_gp46 [Pelagibacter phage Hroenn EXVC015P]|nr:hypothetical protein Bylgja_gp18 [Pelagibacter phage Bylgja EXVC010P]QLF88314.1 hypothetical protein Himinglaeva_gp18 [Pelagibacter phage Himinglaeva EXVC011P]QLF88391.1 hypothetical protein Hroenn_gp46 [Pelagibacter phage Hroenn EXVC015P]QLF88562.1 hypothetical protein Unn_gp4 [Pelagibacter phage Unn EXVC019P]